MTCQCSRPPALFSQRVERRVVLQASAAFAAMAAIGGMIPRFVRAQGGEGTRAETWFEPQNAGSFAAASEPRVLPSDFTFYAVAPHWSGGVDFPGFVEMSFSPDGQSWSDPVTVAEANIDAGPPDRDNRKFGQLALIDGANYLQYRSFDEVGNPTSLADLAFTYIDATGGPTIDDVFSAAVTPSVERPPIISREMWGADERYRHEDQDPSEPIQWSLDYQTVEHVIIHHTVTPNFQDPLLAMRSIYYYHAVTRGWGDIGYNYLVDFMGNVYEGRYGGDNVIGGHSYRYAQGSSGIGTIGTYSSIAETPEAQAGLIWITAWAGRNLDPLGFADFHETSDLPNICAHRDVNDTDCPGDALYSDLDWIRTSVAAVLAGQVDPDPNATYNEGDIVSIATDAANVRNGPGLDFDVITVAPFGALFEVIDGPTTTDGYTWYELSGDTTTGWCAEELLAMYEDVPAPPPPAEFDVGDQVFVDTDALNLRGGPGLDYGVVVTIANGTIGEVTDGPSAANGYSWYHIQTDQGSGWGVSAYLSRSASSIDGPFDVGDEVVVDTDALNLRTGPSANRGVVATMPTGARLTITAGPEESGGYIWYETSSSNYGNGWCVAEFLALASDNPGGGGRFDVGDDVVVDTDALNLRSGHGTGQSVVAVMPTGATLTVTDGPQSGNGYTWYEVASEDYGDGWCVEDFLAPSSGSSGGFDEGDVVFVDTDVLNLRSQASASSNVQASMPTGTRLEITGSSRGADGYVWYPVDSDTYGTGWSAGEFLSLVSSGAGNGIDVGSNVRVIDGALNLRSKPGIDSDILAELPNGTRLQVISGPEGGASYTWYEVQSSTFGDGWCAAEYLEPV
ncbi:MAG: SH3 domain-containing protein [Thermomicrobiales bacterium]